MKKTSNAYATITAEWVEIERNQSTVVGAGDKQ